MTDPREMPAKDDEELYPVDPDIVLIGNYLGKELSAEEAEAVERRMVDDAAFFEKVWPVVRIWRMPLRDRERRARTQSRRPAPSTAPPLAIVPPAGDAPIRSARGGQGASRWRALSAKTTSWIGMAAAVALAAAGIARFGPAMFSVANAADRAPVADIRDSIQVETGRGETKLITLAGGSRLIMRENSRLTYRKFPGGTVSLSMSAFDGELALELNEVDRYAFIKTSAGGTLFTPGTYALRCAPGCKAMLVTAGAGQVLLRGETKDKGYVTLHAGERGRVPKHGRPERVTGIRGWLLMVMSGRGWPALIPAKP
jgi:anti-sigma-K factor RskA